MVLVLEQFVRNLRESRLFSPEEAASVEKVLQASAANSKSNAPPTVEEVARLLIQSGKLTQFQAAIISQGRQQSLILGEYVLLDVLGKGGMGVVYRARHRRMDRVVALKTLAAAKIKDDSVQRFHREVKAAARLSHPNIVTAFDAGEQGGTHYLVMEYVVGRDLAALVKEKGPLPLRQAIDYAQQTARGLEYAHNHGVVHRDVKPSNLLLDKEGVVKILDMGLARLSENLLSENLLDAPKAAEAAELTGAGQILGTVDYMSPEQAVDVHSADHLSDIYSLGCTLFYFLARRPVYPGENILQRVLAHRDNPVPSVVASRPDCPPALDALIQRMLAKRAADRPQSMAEIIAVLETCLANPGAAPPPVAPPVVAPPEKSGPPQSSWLEDLVSDAARSTDDSQVDEATLNSQHTAHSAQTTRRPGSKKGTPGGKGWKLRAGLALIVLLAGACAAAFLMWGDRRNLWTATRDALSDKGNSPEKAEAVASPLLRVRKDGQGDAKTIQEAVNKAGHNGVIQIEEVGPWSESIVIPADKEGLTICGRKGTLPLPTLALVGAKNGNAENIVVHAAQLTLEGVVIAHDDVAGQPGTAIAAEKAAVSLRGAIVRGQIRVGTLDCRQSVFAAGVHAQGNIEAKDCVFFGQVASKASCNLQNVLVCGNVACGPGSNLRHCTITGRLQLSGRVSDSIVAGITADDVGQTIDHCCVYGESPYLKKAVAGKGCFTKRPMFIDAKGLDFNLQANSPCRAAASDGSDLGFTSPPEVQALTKAAELRNRNRLRQDK
jgi:serine/threonine protein kinase